MFQECCYLHVDSTVKDCVQLIAILLFLAETCDVVIILNLDTCTFNQVKSYFKH